MKILTMFHAEISSIFALVLFLTLVLLILYMSECI